jgi:2-oxoacid:acceptor oxidoreductase gamma subunit (pyruvate/2-ketoisovalerate family)
MIEIRIHGRGGQGGVTLAKLLAAAEHREGRSVQAFGIYAAERSGAPLQAFLRADDHPIHNPNMIYEPDHIIVLDPTLIGSGILDGLKPGGFVLLNCELPPDHYADQPLFRAFRVATVDATAIALRHGLGSRAVPIVNTALAGATARLLDLHFKAVLDGFSDLGFHAANARAAQEAFDQVQWIDQPRKPGEREPRTIQRDRRPGLVTGNTGDAPAIRTGQWANRQPVQEDATPPCNFVCPAGNDVQGFLSELAADRVNEALELLLETNPLPSVCGRVCPGFCMQQCNRRALDDAVNVRALERYAGDHGSAKVICAPRRTQKIAIIGSGPAGLSSAYHLARLGYGVSLYEQGDEPGGLMRTGIPAYRLPREALDRDIGRILDLGVEMHLGQRIERERLEAMRADHDAIVVATGLQRLTSIELGIELKQVQQGLEFLDAARSGGLDLNGEQVVVVGGGNTAVDAARTAWRLGARDVRIVYRRKREDMPAIAEEVDEAMDEGVRIDFLTAPVRVRQENQRCLLECQRMVPGEPDASGRCAPVPVPGSAFDIGCDRIILALGQKPDLALLPPISLPDAGHPVTDWQQSRLATAGDLFRNEGTVTAAIGNGREMALRLHAQFSGQDLDPGRPAETTVIRSDRMRLQDFEVSAPQPEVIVQVADRQGVFTEVHQGLETAAEARRCLSCGVCNACDRCVTFCPDGVLRRIDGDLVFDYDYCKGCGVCVTECSRSAIHMKAG